ncbi:MAG: FAD-binding oxidoreductase [Deltaproteobacteria bacterium]|nr:FAD-binding oxidoreductase [Deltaproteobacteria bacterium]
MRDRADLVIIGGGVLGLSLAYHLSRMGFSDIVILEQGYLCFGASGRNGGGIRQQWSTEENIKLAQQSVRMFRQLARETGYNIWFRQGGYLFIARDDESAASLEKNVALQNRLGVPSRNISAAEARRVVPGLSTNGVKICSYNHSDGVLFPWPALWGMARSVQELGVEIDTFTRVTGIDVRDQQIVKVVTDRGAIATNRVVNAAGGWSWQIAKMAGLEIPNKPYRHEILVSEPLRPFLNPMVCDLSDGTYFSQTMRGEICGGLSDPDEPSSMNTGSSFKFLSRMCQSMIRILPRLSGVKILRQWAGYYDETPDGNPVLGRVAEVEGFIQLNGFGGHGFMLAPAIGKIAAEWLLRKSEHEIFTKYSLARFTKGEVKKETLVIG